MKLSVLKLNGKKDKSIELPEQFDEYIRDDLIKRAFLSIRSKERQPYGSKRDAGKRHSVRLSRKRNAYRGTPGIGIARSPRKIMMRRGLRMHWTGAFAPNTVGGRRAHPPKPEKNWVEEINKKERRKAIRCAMSATIDEDLVSKRYNIPSNYPFILSDKIESIKKTSELKEALEKLGFSDELKRAKKKKIRSGKGKMRARKYKKKRSILIVTNSSDSNLHIAAKNLPGVTVKPVSNLNSKVLAPGGSPGRVTLWTESAIKKLNEESLFM